VQYRSLRLFRRRPDDPADLASVVKVIG